MQRAGGLQAGGARAEQRGPGGAEDGSLEGYLNWISTSTSPCFGHGTLEAAESVEQPLIVNSSVSVPSGPVSSRIVTHVMSCHISRILLLIAF